MSSPGTDYILYVCDQKKCENCKYPECKYTTDIQHAKNFKCVLNVENQRVWHEEHE